MIKKYCCSQFGLLCLASVLIILSNVVGYGMGIRESVMGVIAMSLIGLAGLVFNKAISRWIKLPSMLFISLFGLLLAICPIQAVRDTVITLANNLHFMSPTLS